MPENNPVHIYNASRFKMIVAAQQGINPDYDPRNYYGSCSRAIEDQSADFLEDYIAGRVKLAADAEDIMPDFFTILKQSGYSRIKKRIKKAESAYKTALILRRKEEEKKKYFMETDFNILENKKKAAKLSSKDMLLIATLMKDVKDHSVKKRKDKLRSFAVAKIDRTIKGEIPVDEGFAELAEMFGAARQLEPARKKIAPKPVIAAPSSEKTAEKEAETGSSRHEGQKKKQRRSGHPHFWKKLWKAAKRTAVVAGLAVLGYVGIKSVHSELNKPSPDTPMSPKTEIARKTSQAAENTQEETKTADFSKEQSALNKAYKNRFDTALKIILGEEARDKLYQQIDALEKAGRIEYKDGTTREWYAHAFTMYEKISADSKENKAIRDFLAGINNDKDYINSLVVKAGRSGSGVKGNGTYSAFDNASRDLQQEHIKNRKAVRQAEQALAKAKAQLSR